ncbi:MAG: hypothetical protein QOD44_2343 [Solirubrobacteraceae bacterium]|jgi:hypothetical protein|nr:hypothetical protein [Solirubrobacteraceae bacterium]
MDTAGGHRMRLEALIATARADHEALLTRVSPELAASLPVDATGVTQAIDALAAALGIEEEIGATRDRLNRANPAVLHGRVFGRSERLGPATVIAAFAEGARAREPLLERLASEIDGEGLRSDVRAILDAHPAPDAGVPASDALPRLRAAYDAQEGAVLLCAAELDAVGR